MPRYELALILKAMQRVRPFPSLCLCPPQAAPARGQLSAAARGKCRAGARREKGCVRPRARWKREAKEDSRCLEGVASAPGKGSPRGVQTAQGEVANPQAL
ncbi:hypothetical protein NDU88_001428 [Pleurodeles waltl]|uniref:Uncharacterized protein n=1 Tax=Pleurodeles waltl TaxID=8319 RepID=A0AAV7NJ08_PLEWA|nr:hypothetical protein NDU88_001428 [Pleurodeles waltl]